MTQSCAEEWRPIPDWPYEVSNLGRIRTTRSVRGLVAGSFAKIYWLGQVYPCVRLFRLVYKGRTESRQFRVHLLVAEAFLGPRPAGYEVNHIDLDKHNARAENLEYVTSSENKLHAVRGGAWAIGERRWNSTLTEEKVRKIWELRGSGFKVSDIAAEIQASESAIYHVIRGTNWKHLRPPHTTLP